MGCGAAVLLMVPPHSLSCCTARHGCRRCCWCDALVSKKAQRALPHVQAVCAPTGTQLQADCLVACSCEFGLCCTGHLRATSLSSCSPALCFAFVQLSADCQDALTLHAEAHIDVTQSRDKLCPCCDDDAACAPHRVRLEEQWCISTLDIGCGVCGASRALKDLKELPSETIAKCTGVMYKFPILVCAGTTCLYLCVCVCVCASQGLPKADCVCACVYRSLPPRAPWPCYTQDPQVRVIVRLPASTSHRGSGEAWRERLLSQGARRQGSDQTATRGGSSRH